MGQTEKGPQRADVFRSSPESGHRSVVTDQSRFMRTRPGTKGSFGNNRSVAMAKVPAGDSKRRSELIRLFPNEP